MPAERFVQLVHSDQWSRLDEAMAAGRGVIIVGLHLGSWDAAAVVAAQRYPTSVVADFVETPQIDAYVRATRARLGVGVIPYENAARGCLRVLRRKEILGLLIDRPTPEGGVVVDFCGAPVAVPTGPARLALMTGAAILTGAVIRLSHQKFICWIDTPVFFQPSANPRDDIRRVTQAIMERLEVYARRYPEQMFMFRRFWLKDLVA